MWIYIRSRIEREKLKSREGCHSGASRREGEG
jgi:hypothetical protein